MQYPRLDEWLYQFRNRTSEEQSGNGADRGDDQREQILPQAPGRELAKTAGDDWTTIFFEPVAAAQLLIANQSNYWIDLLNTLAD
jgi:hypothetical protein